MTEKELSDIRARTRNAVDVWGDTVYRLALSRTRNPEDAKDIFQNVFLKFMQSTKSFLGKEHEKAWLIRTTIHCSVDLHRSAWKQRNESFEEHHENLVATLIDPGDHDHDPSPELAQAMQKLSETQRTIIHLHYFEEYSTDEIATLLEENPSTVRSHLRRGRAVIKESLGVTDE